MYLASIPFRPSAGGGASLLTTLGWALVLLGALAGVLYLLNRRGWLAHWQSGAEHVRRHTSALRPPNRLVRQATQRLGRNSVVHLIEVDGKRFVVVESRAGVAIKALGTVATEMPR